MSSKPEADRQEAQFEALCTDLQRLQDALGEVIVGQQQLIEDLVTAIFAGGHVLLEGLPGLGKTHLAKALAASTGLGLARIQCTPDLMPADITGSEILVRDDQGQQRLDFRSGPLFAPLVLVDEINRATPKTQAALLEAMQEHQVTYAGRAYALPDPFHVIASQNPIELEGTYPLPEAQLDRFMLKLHVGYPEAEAMRAMLDVSLDAEPADTLPATLDAARLREITALARAVLIAEPVKQAAVDLILATHPRPDAPSPATRHIRYGASPRGLQSLLRAARVRALQQGRAQVAFEDLRRLAPPVLRHRLLLRMESEMEGVEVDSLIHEILGRIVPAQ